jgi:hypothetical protein
MNSTEGNLTGARVELCDLSVRRDLNTRKGVVEGAVSTAPEDRLIVRLDKKDKEGVNVVRVRRRNVKPEDQILVHDSEGKAIFVDRRANWTDRQNWEASAASVFFFLSREMARKTGGSDTIIVTVSAYLTGKRHSYEPPPIIATRLPPEKEKFWDRMELLTEIRAYLAKDALDSGASPPSVEEAKVDWSTASDDEFRASVIRVLQRAHSDPSVVQVALRTFENTKRFAIVQIDSCDHNSKGLCGTQLLSPVECIVFHKDNMVKLPTSEMNVEQASRKVAELVREGVDAPCPICLEPLAENEQSAFLPCSCKGTVHQNCLRRLRDNGCNACPLCRASIGADAWSRAL